jgi:hypothetical protein
MMEMPMPMCMREMCMCFALSAFDRLSMNRPKYCLA